MSRECKFDAVEHRNCGRGGRLRRGNIRWMLRLHRQRWTTNSRLFKLMAMAESTLTLDLKAAGNYGFQSLVRLLSTSSCVVCLKLRNCNSERMRVLSSVIRENPFLHQTLQTVSISSAVGDDNWKLMSAGASELGTALRNLSRLKSLSLHCNLAPV